MEISRIRLIRPDVKVWLLYAGSGRRFFELFRESKSAFLSLPGFDASENVFQSDELMRRHLAMSDAIGKWIRGATNNPPSRRAMAYDPFPYATNSADGKSFSAELGNIERLFVEAKPGDVVLSPPYGHYEPYLIGEIRSNWSKDDDLSVPLLNGEIVPTRRVRWLDVALAKRDFPARVSRRLQNKHAITQVDPEYYVEIFDLIYSAYSWNNISKLDVFGEDYKGTDPLQPYNSALLLKYILASVSAFQLERMDEFQRLSPTDAIDQFYDEELVTDFGQNFNSPGKYTIAAALAAAATLIAGGLFVANADPGLPFHQTQQAATTAVKAALFGHGKAEQSDDLDNYINSLRAVNWHNVQRDLGAKSKASLPLSLDNRRDVARHRAQLNAQ